MRIVTALAILVLLVGSAYADPTAVEQKPWELQLGPPRAIVPEAEPNDTCPGQIILIGDVVQPAALSPAGDLDWYSFDANAGDVLTIGTDAWNASTTDTYIELYAACSGVMIAGDDDGGPSLFSLLSYTVPTTGQYNVKVRGFSTVSVGEYKFFVSMQNPPPANDVCAGAIVLDRCTSGNLQGDLTPYTNNYDPGSGGCATGFPEAGKDEVYKVDLQVGDVINMTYTQLSADAAFYVVTDCSNVAGSCVVGADDAGGVEVIGPYTVTAAGTYYIILDCYGTNTGGPWTLVYAFDCPGPPAGACCVGEVCYLYTETQCIAAGGTWLGPGTDCQPNPCVIPVEDTSWGQIKATYR